MLDNDGGDRRRVMDAHAGWFDDRFERDDWESERQPDVPICAGWPTTTRMSIPESMSRCTLVLTRERDNEALLRAPLNKDRTEPRHDEPWNVVTDEHTDHITATTTEPLAAALSR